MFSGFVGDQREYNDRMNNKTHPPVLKSGPGMIEPVERFRLNNLSFAGPVIMGVGGKKFETCLAHRIQHPIPKLRILIFHVFLSQ